MSRLAFLIVSAPLLIACSSAKTSPPPAAPGQGEMGAAALAAGSKVLVMRNNQWLPGNVVRQEAGGRLLVHYEGYGPEWDEQVGPERVRAVQQPGTTAGGDGPMARDYRTGEKVLVRVQNRLLLADVVQQVSASVWRVHYDGYGPEVAENVGPERMRRPHSGVSARGLGQAIGVDVGGGRVMPGKVIAIVAVDRWVVRFDGFGPEYDQEVGADKVREIPKSDALPTAATTPGTAPPAAATPADAGDKTKNPKDKDKDKAKGKPDKPAEPAVVAPTGPIQVGESVVVAHRSAFHPATVAAVGPGGSLRVRYEATAGGAAEEEVPPDRVTRLPAAPKPNRYTANQKVFIEWHGM
jgi:hypothetical protein